MPPDQVAIPPLSPIHFERGLTARGNMPGVRFPKLSTESPGRCRPGDSVESFGSRLGKGPAMATKALKMSRFAVQHIFGN
ncbi:MAG TPA: hypothetical protein VNQ76_01155 [Planctomicrobium sp.]|nr:hypothetical protein [Planctomicrobium sp.]